MDTLLNQLKEQDLELYQEIVADLLPSSDHRNNFIICGKLQEAIRVRGWGYQMLLFRNPTVYEAYIVGNRETISRGDTEAEALLQAYLSALSASQ